MAGLPRKLELAEANASGRASALPLEHMRLHSALATTKRSAATHFAALRQYQTRKESRVMSNKAACKTSQSTPSLPSSVRISSWIGKASMNSQTH